MNEKDKKKKGPNVSMCASLNEPNDINYCVHLKARYFD